MYVGRYAWLPAETVTPVPKERTSIIHSNPLLRVHLHQDSCTCTASGGVAGNAQDPN